MEIALSIICGLLVGIIGTLGVQGIQDDAKDDTTAAAQQEVIKQLTSIDLIAPICSANYIKENGNLLCRELACLQFTRGIDSKTAGQQCEQISNINNKLAIRKACEKMEDAKKQACIDLFWRRN